MNFDRPIVIDTGVLVSAAIRPQSVLALALERALLHYEVCVSQATLAELQDVLRRSKFDRYASPEARQAFVEGLLQHVRMVEVTLLVSDCSDPKDDNHLRIDCQRQRKKLVVFRVTAVAHQLRDFDHPNVVQQSLDKRLAGLRAGIPVKL